MSGEKEPGAGEAAGLRVVVDAQIALAMFLARRDDPASVSPKRQLLRLLNSTSCYWLCFVTGIARFIGVLEVASEPYLDETRIWTDDVFPHRVDAFLNASRK